MRHAREKIKRVTIVFTVTAPVKYLTIVRYLTEKNTRRRTTLHYF
jgi:hypothetical protein